MKRTVYFIGFFICAALLISAYYFQYARGIAPCPLCIMQRIAFFLIGLTFLLAFIHNPNNKKIQFRYLLALLVFILFGLIIAMRQVYLQHLPIGSVSACTPGLNFMLQNFPIHETLRLLFYGGGDCAIVHWRFIGLSMAEWALICFSGFLIAAIYCLIKRNKKI